MIEKIKKPYWYSSIKTKLLVIMLAMSVIPLLFFGLYNLKVMKQEIEESIHSQHALTAVRISHTVLDLVKSLQISLETVASTSINTLLRGSFEEQEKLLYGILKSIPYLEEVSIISKDKVETAKISKRYTVAREDLQKVNNGPWFDKLKKGHTFIDSPKIDRDNQIVFNIIVPVGGCYNEFLGAIIVKVSLRQVMKEITSIELSDGSYVMLIDERGMLIGHSDYSQVLRGQDVSDSKGVKVLLETKAARQDTANAQQFEPITYKSYTGEDVLGVYGLVPLVNWGVIVEQPLSTAYIPIREMTFSLNFILILIIGAVVVLVSVFVSHFFKPINALAKGVDIVRQGDLNYRIPRQGKDELSMVIEAFNNMTKEIQKKRNQEKLMIQAEKRAAIGVLAAGVAHEINNPINNLGFYADDLLERLEEEDVDELHRNGIIRNYLLTISQQIWRCAEITQSLLNFSRETEAHIRPVDIRRIIEETIKLVRHRLQKQGIEVNIRCEDQISEVLGDESQLRQILLNLITNGIDAMEKGGSLSIDIEKTKDNMVLKVTDTGQGIPLESIHRVFDPFYTTKPVGQGTGLGLAISQAIVEKVGGNIELESYLGKGTEVKVTLPISIEVIENDTI